MRASIKEIVEKIKLFYTSVPIEPLFAIVVILVGFASFGLGRLSVLEETREHVKLTYNADLNTIPVSNISGAVVASRKGKKYHYPWCSGATHMAERNKVWYKSIEEAKRAGKLPAGNCKGLQ
jgi:hypothetical protein